MWWGGTLVVDGIEERQKAEEEQYFVKRGHYEWELHSVISVGAVYEKITLVSFHILYRQIIAVTYSWKHTVCSRNTEQEMC